MDTDWVLKTNELYSDIIDLLPKIPQVETSRLHVNAICPNCGRSGIGCGRQIKPKLIGWTETSIGLGVVLECPECYKQWWKHITRDVWDINEFRKVLEDKYITENGYCSNSTDLWLDYNGVDKSDYEDCKNHYSFEL